jgi:hypothetical protein
VTSISAQPPFYSVVSICWQQSAACTTDAQEASAHLHALSQLSIDHDADLKSCKSCEMNGILSDKLHEPTPAVIVLTLSQSKS